MFALRLPFDAPGNYLVAMRQILPHAGIAVKKQAAERHLGQASDLAGKSNLPGKAVAGWHC
jgi:hypothetical protein